MVRWRESAREVLGFGLHSVFPLADRDRVEAMDRRTLFTVQAGLLLFMGGVLLLSYVAQARTRRDRGAPWFASAYFCAGFGLFLQSFRGSISPLYSILVGNGLFLLFGALGNRAIARTTGQKKDHMVLLLLLDAAVLVNFAYFTWWQPDVLLRTVEAALVLGVIHVAAIDLLRRNADHVIRPATRAMIGFHAAHCVSGLARTAIVLKLHVPDAAFSWFGIVTIAGLALSYLWIDSLRTQEELKRTAMTDPLTGLLNRRGLDIAGLPTIEYSRRHDLPCSALMLDVDRFKQTNDSMGHAAGDACLCAVASALQTTLRSTDIATRLGGDEFFVLLPDCDEGQADLIVARLNNAIAGLELRTMGHRPFKVAASVGRVTLRGADLSMEELLHGSDILLYREKQKLRAQSATGAIAHQGSVSAAQLFQPYLRSQ